MFGVVLWSDTEEKKAVIWCEDHGDLAFYRQGEDEGSLELDAGDLVRFDMTVDRELRYAHNPRLVVEDYHPDIADALVSSVDSGSACRGDTGMNGVANRRAAQPERLSAQIIPFRPGAKRRVGTAERAELLLG